MDFQMWMTASDIFAKFDFHCAILQQITHKYISATMCQRLICTFRLVNCCQMCFPMVASSHVLCCMWPGHSPLRGRIYSSFLLNLVGSVTAWTKRKQRKLCCMSEKNIDLGNFCLLFSGMLNLRIYSLT